MRPPSVGSFLFNPALMQKKAEEDHVAMADALQQPLEKASDAMDTDESAAASSGTAAPEVELYLAYLVFLFRFEKRTTDAAAGAAWLDAYVTKAQAYNRRTLDLLTAKFFFWSAKLAEEGPQYAAIRPALTNALRTATVRQDIETQVFSISFFLR